MYTIHLDEKEARDYRRLSWLRQSYQQSADQQMASRLEPVEIVAPDGEVLYRNLNYKGSVSDLAWHEATQRG